MKRGWLIAAIVLGVLLVLAVLLSSQRTSFARRAAREASRAARFVTNISQQVSPRPVVIVRIWDAPRSRAFRVELFESGLLVVSSGYKAERQLSRDATEHIVEMATLALGQFNARGCETVSNGSSADLYVMADGRWQGSVCRNWVDWPRGAETRQLLIEIRSQLPSDMTFPIDF